MSPTRLLRWAAALSGLLSVAVLAQDLPSRDVPGSHDHPIVSRFAGSVIAGYQSADYDAVQLPTGKYAHTVVPMDTAEGKVTRIFYVAPPGKSAMEVFHNFRQALTEAGFRTRFSCEREQCGDAYDFADQIINPLLDTLHARNLMVATLAAVSNDVHELTAHLERPEGAVDLVLLVSKSDHYPAGILLEICEHKAMAQREVTVDAKAMSEGLAQAGHIALYGIHFASDSATVDPSSKDTLGEMAKLLSAHPAMKVYIVGHTDDTGALAHNLALSQQRAEAVVTALERDYHIAPARLAAKGLASYAPVASNHDDAGRARNRRVELVEQ